MGQCLQFFYNAKEKLTQFLNFQSGVVFLVHRNNFFITKLYKTFLIILMITISQLKSEQKQNNGKLKMRKMQKEIPNKCKTF